MTKRLYRSRTDRWIAGVCGGLAEYFSVDPTAIRVAFVLLALWQGLGALVYVVLAFVIPDEPVTEIAVEPGLPPPPMEEDEENRRRTRLLGGLLMLVGAYVLLRNSPLMAVLWRDAWVGALLVLGGLFLLLVKRSH